MRKRTGLRNRYRTGKGSYHKKKAEMADHYDRPMIDHPHHPHGARYVCCRQERTESQ